LAWFSGKIYGLASCFCTRSPPKLSPNRDLLKSLSLRDVVYVRARADNPLLQAQDENDDKDPKQSCSLRREQVCSPATQRTIKRIELLNEGQPSSHAVWTDRSGCAFAALEPAGRLHGNSSLLKKSSAMKASQAIVFCGFCLTSSGPPPSIPRHLS